MPTISLSGKKKGTVLIDDRDASLVIQYPWYLNDMHHTLRYAYTIDNGVVIQMHRLILGVTGLPLVDHRNGNGLDNQRQNLRLCTHTQNGRNRRLAKHNTSGITGVHWNRHRERWIARVVKDGVHTHVGSFTSIEDALEARLTAAMEIDPEFYATARRAS